MELSKDQIIDTCRATIDIMRSKHITSMQAIEEACRINNYPISFFMKNKIIKIMDIIYDAELSCCSMTLGGISPLRKRLEKELELVKKGDYHGLKKMELDRDLEIEKRISELEKCKMLVGII